MPTACGSMRCTPSATTANGTSCARSQKRFAAACAGRHVHLILENDLNEARWLERAEDGLTPTLYTAQWNDDAHHCWHTLLSGERDGYYADFAEGTPAKLGRSLAEGYVYQGDPSPFRNGEKRGERSAHLHPAAFIDFLQNHDQIGNRAFGERLDAIADPQRIAVARAALLLSPHIPLLFMGEEWGALTPFLYFVDFTDEPELARAVRDGRRREFEGFRQFADGGVDDIPDPNALATFTRSRLDPSQAMQKEHAESLSRDAQSAAVAAQAHRPAHRLALPRRAVAPATQRRRAIDVQWRFEAGSLRLILNVGPRISKSMRRRAS